MRMSSLDPLAMAVMEINGDEASKERNAVDAGGNKGRKMFDIIAVTSLAHSDGQNGDVVMDERENGDDLAMEQDNAFVLTEQSNKGKSDEAREVEVSPDDVGKNASVVDKGTQNVAKVSKKEDYEVSRSSDSRNEAARISSEVSNEVTKKNDTDDISKRNDNHLSHAINRENLEIATTNKDSNKTSDTLANGTNDVRANQLSNNKTISSVNSRSDHSYAAHSRTTDKNLPDQLSNNNMSSASAGRDHSYSAKKNEYLSAEEIEMRLGQLKNVLSCTSTSNMPAVTNISTIISSSRTLICELLLAASLGPTLEKPLPQLSLLHILCFASGSFIFPGSSKILFLRLFQAMKKGTRCKISYFKSDEKRVSSEFVRLTVKDVENFFFKPPSIKDAFDKLSKERSVFVPIGAVTKMNDYARKSNGSLVAAVYVHTKTTAIWQKPSADIKLIRSADTNKNSDFILRPSPSNNETNSKSTKERSILKATLTAPMNIGGSKTKRTLQSSRKLGSFDMARLGVKVEEQYEAVTRTRLCVRCETCCTSFQCIHMFVMHFVASQSCRDALARHSPKHKDFRSNLADLVAEQLDKPKYAGLRCDVCDKVLFGPLAYCLHRDEHRREDGRLYGCHICGHIFLSPASFFGHKCIRTWKLTPPVKKISSAINGNGALYAQLRQEECSRILTCPFCGTQFKFMSKLLLHFGKPTSHACMEQLLLLFRSKLQDGVALHRIGLDEIECERCGFKCPNSMAYAFHMDHHEEIFKCDGCNRQYSSVCSFYDHECTEVDTDGRRLHCTFCQVLAPNAPNFEIRPNKSEPIALIDLTRDEDIEICENNDSIGEKENDDFAADFEDDVVILDTIPWPPAPKRRKTTSVEEKVPEEQQVLSNNLDTSSQQRSTSPLLVSSLKPVKMEGFLCLDCDPHRILPHGQALTAHCMESNEHDFIRPLSFYNRLSVRLHDLRAIPENRSTLDKLLGE